VRIVIVGGGKVGGYLTHQLNDAGYTVTVCEQDPARAERLAEAGNGLVINGDGTDVEVLTGARVDRADWLLAVTGADETNLVACELGLTLGNPRTLARLNDPRNRPTFDALKIPVVAVTDLIGEVIERALDPAQLERITLFGRGALSLIEVEIPHTAKPRRVEEIGLPPETLVVAVLGETGLVATVPGSDTVVGPGSKVMAVTTLEREPQVRDALVGVDS
jgi:trk system potassium uptake protein TrkA